MSAKESRDKERLWNIQTLGTWELGEKSVSSKPEPINKIFEENSLQEPATEKVTDMDIKETTEKLVSLNSVDIRQN